MAHVKALMEDTDYLFCIVNTMLLMVWQCMSEGIGIDPVCLDYFSVSTRRVKWITFHQQFICYQLYNLDDHMISRITWTFNFKQWAKFFSSSILNVLKKMT